MSTTESMREWPLAKVVDALKAADHFSARYVYKNGMACRRYEEFRGSTQRACDVTTGLLDLFAARLIEHGYTRKYASIHTTLVAAVVRFADPELMPNRIYGKFIKGVECSLQFVMEHDYFPEKSKIASVTTERQYIFAASRYSQFLGRFATIDDLTDKSVGKWLRSMRDEGLAAMTINGYLNKIRAFWSWCAKKRIVEQFPTIEDLPEPRQIPRAWSEVEMRALVEGAGKMPGDVGDVPASVWWRCLHQVAFDTGERCSALLNLKWTHYDPGDATIEAPAEIRKGGRKPMLYRLKPVTVAGLAAIPRSHDEIFHWPFCNGTFYLHYNKRLLPLANLPYVTHKSGLQKVRRTFASHIENAGGNATAALGHTARRVTEESYLDPRIIKQTQHNDVLFEL